MARREWDLEKLAAGEGTPGPNDTEALAHLRESNEEILREHAPASVAAEVQRRLEARKRSRSPLLWIAAPALAVAAVVLLVPRPPPGNSDGINIKGLEPHLLVFRQTANEPERLGADAQARPGDVIQMRYVAAGEGHGVVLSIDGRGAVTLHYPEDPRGSTVLQAGEKALPHAYQLDDAPAFERFFFLTSEEPLDVAALLQTARTLAATPDRAQSAPFPSFDAQHQTSLTLRKVSP